eukprot:CFRG4748T1
MQQVEMSAQSQPIQLPLHLLKRQKAYDEKRNLAAAKKSERGVGACGGDWKGLTTQQSTENFWTAFNHDATELTALLDKTCNNSSANYDILFSHLSALVAKNAEAMTSYDVGRAQKQLLALQTKMYEAAAERRQTSTTPTGGSANGTEGESVLDPNSGSASRDVGASVAVSTSGGETKKRFTFKNRSRIVKTPPDLKFQSAVPTPTPSVSATATLITPTLTTSSTPIPTVTDKPFSLQYTHIPNSNQTSVTVEGGRGHDIILKREELSGEVCISNLTDCNVYLDGQCTSVRIRDVLRCHIYTGVVSQSVMVFNANECVLQLACGQVRVHDTTKTDLFLLVASNPIIEDSNGLRFGKYTYDFDDNERNILERGLDKDSDLWKAVLDFQWQHPGKPSPNWTLYEE